jgi:hypothetical protein
MPAKKQNPIVDSKEFNTEDPGMSMTIGNEDYDEREDESLMDPEMKQGKDSMIILIEKIILMKSAST